MLEAALTCLAEKGYARTTTSEVAERAGMSRGAQLHHFPTRADLLAATIEHLLETRFAVLMARIQDLPAGTDPVSGSIAAVWSAFSDPAVLAALELVVAARTDPELKDLLRSVSDRFFTEIESFEKSFGGDDAVTDRIRTIRSISFLTMAGLSIIGSVHHDPGFEDEQLALLEDMARRMLADLVDLPPRTDS